MLSYTLLIFLQAYCQLIEIFNTINTHCIIIDISLLSVEIFRIILLKVLFVTLSTFSIITIILKSYCKAIFCSFFVISITQSKIYHQQFHLYDRQYETYHKRRNFFRINFLVALNKLYIYILACFIILFIFIRIFMPTSKIDLQSFPSIISRLTQLSKSDIVARYLYLFS